MNRFLFLFQSTHSVIKAEKVCLNAGISCSVIAIPRDISSECGMALEVDLFTVAFHGADDGLGGRAFSEA